jgi:hypothetical protein
MPFWIVGHILIAALDVGLITANPAAGSVACLAVIEANH